jgi:RNA polymerase sigma factor (sigma-70 family)
MPGKFTDRTTSVYVNSAAMTDCVLLVRHAAGDSTALSLLVERYAGLVYAAALRQLAGRHHLAQEVSQMVFITMASQSRRLIHHAALVAWLHRTTRFFCLRHLRAEARYARRLVTAAADPTLSTHGEPGYEGSTTDWQSVAPILDRALDTLSETDRRVVLWRYFEQRNYGAIGEALQLTENSARMRTERACEKLRRALAKLGVRSTTSALAFVLAGHASAAPAPSAVLSGILHALRVQSTHPVPPSMPPPLVPEMRQLVLVGILLISGGVGGGIYAFLQPAPPATAQRQADFDTLEKPQPSFVAATLVSPSTLDVSGREILPDSRNSLINWLASLRDFPTETQLTILQTAGLPPVSAAKVTALRARHASALGYGLALFDHWKLFAPNELLLWAANNFEVDATGGTPKGIEALLGEVYYAFIPSNPLLDGYTRRVFAPSRELRDMFAAWGWGADYPALQKFGFSDDLLYALQIYQRQRAGDASSQSSLKYMTDVWPSQAADKLLPWARSNLSQAEFSELVSNPDTAGLVVANALDQALELLPLLAGEPAEGSWVAAIAGELTRRGRLSDAQAMRDLAPVGQVGPGSRLRPGMSGLDARGMATFFIAREQAINDPEAAIAWINSQTFPADFDAALNGALDLLPPDQMRRVLEDLSAQADLPAAQEIAALTALRNAAVIETTVVARADIIADFVISRGAQRALARPAADWMIAPDSAEKAAAARFDIVERATNTLARSIGPISAREWASRFSYASDADRQFMLEQTSREKLSP